MINLLPESEKKNIEHEYKLRRLALILMSCIGLVVTILIMMIPMYVISIYKSNAIGADTATAIAQDKADQQLYKKQLDDARTLVRVLKPQAAGLSASGIVNLLVKNKSSDIQITGIADAMSGGSATIIVTGIAKNREALSSFTDALSHEKGIAKVDVPVSNFAKDTNIAYTFTITTN